MLPILAASFVLVVILALVFRRFQTRRLSKLFQEVTPEPLVDFYFRALKRAPQGRYYAAAAAATAYALYGDRSKAEDTLQSVEWQRSPPLVRAQRTLAEAVILYVAGEYSRGYQLTQQAEQEAEINAANPGARTAARTYRMYLALGKALVGSDLEAAKFELQAARDRLPGIGKFLALWGLGAIAKWQGDERGLQAVVATLEAEAPGFRPVLEHLKQ